MNPLGWNEQQLQKLKSQPGFVAALDESGGSTPKTMADYGIKEGSWSDEEDMCAILHRMRTRLVTSPSFGGDRIVGAILSEDTIDRHIQGAPVASYLWIMKRIVPLLKVDKDVAEEKNGVRLTKPMPQLELLLKKAKTMGIFGAKTRSVINILNLAGIRDIVDQQFDVGAQILSAGLVPIFELEVDIHCPDKARAEAFLKIFIVERLNRLPSGQLIFLKLTLPEQDDLYLDLVRHPKVARVLALSGGYSRAEANARLRRNHGVAASFSRALVEGLRAQQSDYEFNTRLDAAVQSIFEASTTKRAPRKPTTVERKGLAALA